MHLRWHVALRAGHFLERGLSVRSGCVAQGAAHARALRRAGLEARVPGKIPTGKMPVARCAARGAFPGARTFSPQRLRGAGRGACAGPMACGLGSPRSRRQCSRLGISPERGLSVRSKCVAHGAAHARAQWPAGLEARVPGGSARGRAFPGARTFSPQRVRGAERGACACPSACGLGSPRSCRILLPSHLPLGAVCR